MLVVGRGKVGRALAAACRAAGVPVRHVAARGPLPRRAADLVVLAVPDAAIAKSGVRWAPAVAPGGAMLHTAGLETADALAGARRLGVAVGQAHPLASLVGATLLVGGDAIATRRAAWLARRLRMRPLVDDRLDRAAWHAVAALVANGAAALAGLGVARLGREGLSASDASRALGVLLRTVASNLERAGIPRALSGPVRRGDAAAAERHLRALRTREDAGARLAWAALALAQVAIAERLAEAAPASLRRISAAARAILRGRRPAAPERGSGSARRRA